MDGASNDATVEIARRHSCRPHIISEPDKGIYDAINKGIERANGCLIGVLGSDDKFTPGALAKLHSLHSRTNSDIVFGRALMVDETGRTELRQDEPYGPGALISGIPFCHNAMFVTPECFARVGSYDLSYRICADAAWVHRAIKLGCSASSVQDPIVAFSLGGLSSGAPDEIMNETYRVIAANFESVTPAEGRILIEAARGWGPTEPAFLIAEQHRSDALLQSAVAHALRQQSVSPKHDMPFIRFARGLRNAIRRRNRPHAEP